MLTVRGAGYEARGDWLRVPEGYPQQDVTGVAVGPDGLLYLLTRNDPRVLVYDADGAFVKMWGEGLFTPRAHGIRVAPDGAVFCTDDDGHNVRKFSPDGELLMTLGVPGVPSDTGYDGRHLDTIVRAGPPFNHPTNAAIAANGDIYVTDGYGNARVHRFSADGELLQSWGEPGSGPGQFMLPHDLTIDAEGRLLVGDRANERIQVFSPTGEYLAEWGGVHPNGLSVDSDGWVYVGELPWQRGQTSRVYGAIGTSVPGYITVLDPDGDITSRWGGPSGSFTEPHSIAVDARGDIYLADITEHALHAGRVQPGVPPFYKLVRRPV
jgi:DNA-binding beta-propeller fold protein YncE